MDSNVNPVVDQNRKNAIITAVRDGSLTAETISTRLKEMVECEIAKKHPDFELIRICEELLWEMNAPQSFSDDKEESKRAFMEKLNRKEANKQRFKPLTHKFALAAAAVVAVIAIGVYGSSQWLLGQSTKDEQQYEISGVKVDPGILQKGNAAADRSELREIRTTEIEEVNLFLGYTPPSLAYTPKGMQIKRYNAGILSTSDDFSAMYVAEDGTSMRYGFTRYFDTETATARFEQDKQGSELKVGDIAVYYSTNVGDNICIWFDGLDCYSLSSPLPMDEMLALATETILLNGGT